MHLALHECRPLRRFDLGQQPVAHVEQDRSREQHRPALDRLALAGCDLEQQLDEGPGEQAGGDRQPRAARDLATPLGRTRFGEKRHQGRDDQNRFESFAQQEEKRGDEQAHRRRTVRDGALRPLESGQQPLADHVFLIRVGARRPHAQPRERRLEITGEPRVPRAHFGFYLFEREIGVERDFVGAGGECGIDLTTNCRERRRRRRPAVLHCGDVRGNGPPILLRKVLAKLRHRCAGHADRDPAEYLEHRRPTHHGGIGEIRRWRPLHRLRLRTVPLAALSMAGGAPLMEHHRPARERGWVGRQCLQDVRPAGSLRDERDE